MYYSASTGGFYSRDIHGDSIPADAVEISMVQYSDLLLAQCQGKVIVADGKGYPLAADPSPPGADEVKRSNSVERDARLSNAALRIAPLQDAVDIGVATEAEVSALLAWKRYRVVLNRLDMQVEQIEWPEIPGAPGA